MKKYWYLAVLLVSALVINETAVQWALAIKVGGHSITSGFKDAFEYFSISGYLFFTAFRFVPYIGLGILLVVLSKSKPNDFVLPVFIGGIIGILSLIIFGSWEAQRPFYTDEHVSSTTALAFIFIPFYALPAGAIGAVLFSVLYTPIRYMIRKKNPPAMPTKIFSPIKSSHLQRSRQKKSYPSAGSASTSMCEYPLAS